MRGLSGRKALDGMYTDDASESGTRLSRGKGPTGLNPAQNFTRMVSVIRRGSPK
jgi:hypothetical protein